MLVCYMFGMKNWNDMKNSDFDEGVIEVFQKAGIC